MRPKYAILLFSLGVLLLAGCGSNLARSQGSPSAPTPTRSFSSPTGVPTRPAGAGLVTLLLNARVYQKNDPITVTISNQSSQNIAFPDHLTNCTVILLQRLKVQPQESDRPEMTLDACLLSTSPQIHTLGPGQHLLVRLVAPSNGWVSGLYHAVLSYHSPVTARLSIMISSPVFTIGPLLPQP